MSPGKPPGPSLVALLLIRSPARSARECSGSQPRMTTDDQKTSLQQQPSISFLVGAGSNSNTVKPSHTKPSRAWGLVYRFRRLSFEPESTRHPAQYSDGKSVRPDKRYRS